MCRRTHGGPERHCPAVPYIFLSIRITLIKDTARIKDRKFATVPMVGATAGIPPAAMALPCLSRNPIHGQIRDARSSTIPETPGRLPLALPRSRGRKSALPPSLHRRCGLLKISTSPLLPKWSHQISPVAHRVQCEPCRSSILTLRAPCAALATSQPPVRELAVPIRGQSAHWRINARR
jgi:hypothetical protein